MARTTHDHGNPAATPEFEEIGTGEPAFNDSSDVVARGYTKADKDFSKIQARVSTPIEAWDLRRGDTSYAKAGQVIDLPERRDDRPSPEFFEWHLEEVFLKTVAS